MTQERHAGARLGMGSQAAEFTLPGAKPHYPPDIHLEPVHLDIDLAVEVEARRLEGTVTHTIRARADGARDILLHAVGMVDLRVSAPDGTDPTWRYDGREIHVDWEEAFSEGEERKLAITYKVEDPVTGLFFSGPTDAYPEQALYAATDHETERARYWLPTVDLPSVRPTLDFHLRADARLSILANGELVGEDEHDDGTRTAHWHLEQPCPSYITCFAIGDFIRYDEDAFDGRPLAWFTTRYFEPDDLQRSFGRTRDMLAWMEKKLDFAFPYPKYFQFALPGFGGAMENISLVSWDDVFVLDETLAREWTWLVDQINVHEMAHSYFGDMVVCRDYAHAWLKESWATYTETLWLEDSKGKDEADYDVYTNIDAYAREADESYKRPIVTRRFNHSWQMYDRHLYPGGAARLHMLRKELGDAAFFRGVHLYLKRFAHQVVETADFRRSLEEASGRSLVQWFDQWIHGKGYPKIKAAYAWSAKRKEMTLTIEQTQMDEKEGVGVFRMPLDVGWVVNGELEVRTIDLERRVHVVVARLEKEPEQVRVDPFVRSVLKLDLNPGDDMLLTQLRDARDVVGRIQAANELCKTGSTKNVQAVREAYEVEAFWGVRIRMAEALARAGTQTAVDALAELIDRERDGMVLEPLVRQAGKLRAPAIRQALERRLDDGLELYRATQAAYEALGAQRADAPFDRLVEAATVEDRYGFEQSGALRALAETRRKEAREVIEARTPYGATSNRARPAAATSLGALGRTMARSDREHVGEVLTDLLRDPVDRVRVGAMNGLRTLGEAGTIRALSSYRSTLSEQDQVAADRVVAAIRAGDKPRRAALEKQLDELREKLRKLEDRLGKLDARVTAEVPGGEGQAEEA